ncbi:unnamed protein product, partial [Aphanomyces euteiches]
RKVEMTAMTCEDGDLDFLPKVDEDLLNLVLQVTNCSQNPGSPLHASIRAPKRAKTTLDRLAELRQEKNRLEKNLKALKAQRTARRYLMSNNEKKWEALAHMQRDLMNKSLLEQKQLQAMLAEQTTLQRDLEMLLMTKLENEEWRMLIELSATCDKRLCGIRCIADRQLETVDGEMLSFGVVDATDNFNLIRHDTTKKYSEGIRIARLNASSFDHTAMAIWRALVQVHAKPAMTATYPHNIYKYSVDDNTIFLHVSCVVPNANAKMQSSYILKRQKLGARAVRIVVRSILDDEAIPFDKDSFVCDHHGWIHIEESEDSSCIIYKCYWRGAFAILKPNDVDDLSETMDSLSIEKSFVDAEHFDPIVLAKKVFEAYFETIQSVFLRDLTTK